MGRRAQTVVGTAALLLFGLQIPAHADPVHTVDVLDEHVSIVDGPAKIVGSADVNGDGLDDLVVSGLDRNAQVWVVFAPLPEWIDIDHLNPEDGYLIYSTRWDNFYGAAALAGDVNGDGLHDVAVSGYSCGKRRCAGRTYVVFGKTDGRPVHLNEIGLNPLLDFGYRINGGEESFPPGGAGDVNGDGLDDLLVAGYGEAYVVFGKPDYLPVDAEALERPVEGPAGYWIAMWPRGYEAMSLANAGDVNGDGLADAVVGVVRSNRTRGRAYVIFGQRDTDDIDIETHHLARYRIRGLYPASSTGAFVDGNSDVNGDGVPDQLVTAPGYRGGAFVVFGKSDVRAVRLRNPRHHALQIRGRDNWHSVGISADLTGDVNGDGLGDVALLRYAGYESPKVGFVHVVYGSRDRLVARLDDPWTGFRMTAPCDRSEPCSIDFLEEVAGVADADGDGLRDIAVGARFLARGRHADETKVFVVGSRSWTD